MIFFVYLFSFGGAKVRVAGSCAFASFHSEFICFYFMSGHSFGCFDDTKVGLPAAGLPFHFSPFFIGKTRPAGPQRIGG